VKTYTAGECAGANRTQALVLVFLGLMWASLVAILAVAPEVYAETLKLPPGDRRAVELAFLGACRREKECPRVGQG
jgi:hypothetical protein